MTARFENKILTPEQCLERLSRASSSKPVVFTNGVFDVENLTFLPKGDVPFNVLVCKTTRYAYIKPDDPRCAAKLAEIDEFLRTLHAVDYTDPNDANLATMRMLSGSFLTRGNPYKKVIVFLGAAGDIFVF